MSNLLNYKIVQAILIFCIIFSSNSYTCLEFDDDLVSYYPFQGDANDGFGSNNGSQTGITNASNRQNVSNSAYKFTGTGYVTIPEAVLNTKTQFTITMWVKKENDMNNNFALISGTKTGAKNFVVTGKNYYFSNTAYSTTSIKDNMTLNQWHHVGIIVRTASYKQFVDGKLVFTASKPAYTADFASGGLVIGQVQTALGGVFDTSQGFKGIISDVRIYGEPIPIYKIYEIYFYEQDSTCSFGCQSCNSSNQCVSCKGDRILQDGMCLCPHGLIDDKKSTNCIDFDANNDPKLLNYIPMKSSAYDVVQNHPNTEHQPILANNRFGESSGAFKFMDTPAGQRLNLPSVQATLNGKKTFTFSIWIQRHTIYTTSNNHDWVFNIFTTRNEVLINLGRLNIRDVDTSYQEIGEELVIDEWFHAVFVIGATEVRIYKNGCLYYRNTSLTNLNATMNIPALGVVLGQEQDTVDGTFTSSQTLKATVSDLRIYNEEMASDKVRLLYEKERNECSFSCKLCLPRSNFCAVCRGDRLLLEGRCVCQNGKIDDFKTENCVDRDTTINEDLLAYYPMHNNGLDVVHNNDGIVRNLTPTTNRFNKSNTAFTFVNATTMLTIPHTIFQGLSKVTFSLWALSTETDLTKLRFFLTGASPTQHNIIHISYKNLPFCYNGGGCTQNPHNLYEKMVIGEWYHLVFVCDELTTQLYVDGQLMLDGTKLNQSYPIGDNGFHVGQDQDSLGGTFDSNQTWQGKMSDLRIYGSALTHEDVTLIDLLEKYPCDRSCDYCYYRSQNCHICLPNSTIDTPTICLCNDGYYRNASTYVCELCDYQCSTCQNQSDECLTCSDSNRSTTNTPNCSCDDGWFDQGSSNTICGQCTNRCLTCETSADNCLTCAGANRNQDGPTCSCQDGYYHNGTINCQPCNLTKCQTCETTADNCLICANPNQNNKDPNNNCECKNGFFGSDCGSTCSVACLTCDTSASNCTSCLGTNRELNTCNCIEGYYDNQVDDDCQQCTIPNCVQCDPAAPSECLTPEDRHYLDDNKIPQTCPDNCTACTAYDNCTSCIPSNRGTPSCDCVEGYFENDQDICQQCMGVCQSCSNSTTCDLCNNPNQNNKNPNNNCECLNGFFGNECQSACDSSCLTCDTTATNCTSCLGTNRELNTCNCIEGYYDNQIDDDCQQCTIPNCIQCNPAAPNECLTPEDRHYLDDNKIPQACPDNCTACTAFDNCTSCIPSNRDTPSCECTEGYFENDSGDCQQCMGVCQSCSNSTTCDLCNNPNQNNKDPNNNCECLNGFFGNECQSACDPSCHTCETTATNCTNCLGSNRVIGTCVCEQGYYDNQVDDDCQQCTIPNCVQCDPAAPSECQTPEDRHYLDDNKIPQACPDNCTACTTFDNCTSCIPSNRGTPSCDCVEGYFENVQDTCQQCMDVCQSCSNSTTCDLCNNPNQNNKNPNNNCECLNGFFGNECQSACDSSCLTCDTTATNCTSCLGTNRELNTCNCIEGYYDNQVDDDCQQCTIPNCIQCDPAAPNECLIPEDRHYLDDNKIPQACPDNCTACTAFDNCTSCIPSNRDTPSCECTEGYFENDNGDCQQCMGVCQSCSNSTTCDLCNNPNQNNKDPNNSCECLNGFFDSDCGSVCDPSCLTCDATATNCTSCLGSNRELNTCNCEQGYYDNQVDDDCQQCTIPNCIQCDPAAPNECQTPEDRHYLDDNKIPQACPTHCQSCQDSGQCTQCDASLPERLVDELCTCPKGYYSDQNLAQCQECLEECEECENGNECTLVKNCQSQCSSCMKTADNCIKCLGFNRLPAPSCQCQPGYYDDNVSQNCQICSPQCAECDKANTCTKCVYPYMKLPFCRLPKIFQSFFTVTDPDTGDQIEVNCSPKCKTCEGQQDFCTTCNIGQNRKPVEQNCDCLQGYYDMDSTSLDCMKCPQYCVECDTYGQCQLCDQNQNRQLDQYSLQCICKSGYKETPNQECQKCYLYKNDCVLECPENSRFDQNKQICLDISYQKSKLILLIYLCGGVLVFSIIVMKLVSKIRIGKNFQNFMESRGSKSMNNNNQDSPKKQEILGYDAEKQGMEEL